MNTTHAEDWAQLSTNAGTAARREGQEQHRSMGRVKGGAFPKLNLYLGAQVHGNAAFRTIYLFCSCGYLTKYLVYAFFKIRKAIKAARGHLATLSYISEEPVSSSLFLLGASCRDMLFIPWSTVKG